MKKYVGGIFLFFLILLNACQEDVVEPVPQPQDENARVAATAVVPKWSSKYPAALFGASSVDLKFKTDIASKVYWVLANKELSLTTAVLKTQANKPTIAGIKFNGISTLSAAKEKIEKVTGLTASTKYYLYTVVEGSSTLAAESQTAVGSSTFTTYARQEIKTYRSAAENRDVYYLIYRPEESLKNPTKKFPICFFLGGNGEVTSQGKINMIRNGSLPEFINKGGDVPMIVMSIQHIRTSWNTKLIDEGVSHAFASYPVDTRKVYMTGMSGGGIGTWNYAVAYPTRLTAIVPISGDGSDSKACSLNPVVAYAFHNKVDRTVSANGSINMVNAINKCTPKEKAKLLLFPDTGHNCWRRVYNPNHKDWNKSPNTERIDIYAWMLSKTK